MAAAGARALGWVSAHDGRFAQADDEGADSMPFVKRTAELAVIAATLLDVGHPDGRPLLEKCWGRLGNGATLEKLAPAVPAVATIYVAFWRHGLRSDVLERALVEAAPAAEELYAHDPQLGDR